MPGLVRCSSTRVAVRSRCSSAIHDLARAGDHLGQAEVQNLGVAALGHKDVGWFDVAVNDAGGVGRFKRIGNFDGNGKQRLRFKRTP